MQSATLSPSARSMVRIARSEGRCVLLEHEALEVVQGLGLHVPRHLLAEDVGALASLDLGEFPGREVVVKAVSPHLVHKTDVGAVAVVAKRVDAVVRAAREMKARLEAHPEPDGFLVEEYVSHRPDPGGELLLGIRWSREFGAVVTLGLGGTGVEALARVLPPGEGFASFRPDGGDPERVLHHLEGRTLARLATGEIRGARRGPSLRRLALMVEDALAFAARAFPIPFLEVEVNPLVFTARGPVALDAVVRLSEEGSDAALRPGHEAGDGRIDALLHPRSVAVVGVSERMNPGRVILRNLLAQGFDPERVIVVKPGADGPVDGCRCVPSVAALGEPVDLLVVAVPAVAVPDVLEEALDGPGVHGMVLIPGGLGEREGTEDRGHRVESILERARARSDRRAPRVNGGNCLGIRSVPGRVNTLFIPDRKLRFPDRPPAPLAVLSQSGAFAIARMSRNPRLNPRYLVTLGNQVDLTLGDYLEHLAPDPAIRIFACYVEGFQPLDGRRTLDAARAITASGRTVILYRAGRTPEGASASASHTASVAGDYAITRELAREAGILVAETVEDFDDLLRLSLALDDRPVGGLGLGAMSNAGFETVALADAAPPLTLPTLHAATRDRLADVLAAHDLQDIVGARNPLDVTPILDDEGFAEAAEALLSDPEVDLGVVACVPLTPALTTLQDEAGDGGGSPGLARRLGELWTLSILPWVAVVDGGPSYDAFASALEEGGVPTFRHADRAVRMLGRYASWRRRVREG